MEESGRRGVARNRRGLLRTPSPRFVALLFAAVCSRSFAFDVDFFVSAYETTVGGEIETRVTVFGAKPGETSLEIADIPPELAQASSRKERERVANPASSSDESVQATVITQKWVAVSPGSVTLGPFRVMVGTEAVEIPPVHLALSEPRASGKTELRWRLDGGPARSGEPSRIVLKASRYGTVDAIFCDAPENAILESMPLPRDGDRDGQGSPEPSGEKSSWVPIAAWDWAPLAVGPVSLPVAVVEYTTPEGVTRKAVSPAYTVTVSRGEGARAETGLPRSLGRAFMKPSAASTDAASDRALKSAPLPPELSSLADAELGATLREYWEAGEYGRALAALRFAERSRLFPGRYREARLACEAALAVPATRDVPPAAWKQIAVVAAAFFLSLALALRLVSLRARSVSSLAALSAALAIAIASFAVVVYARDRDPAAVTARADLYHVPDPGSSVVERLPEGLPVRVIKVARDWLYVETPTSLRGWIPSKGAFLYTGTERP